MERELTFDEFRSQTARAQAAPATQDPATQAPAGGNGKKTGLGIGAFLEMNEMQAFYIFVLIADLVGEYMNMALELEIGEMDVENPVLTTYVMLQNTISSFSTFARMFFGAELLALLVLYKFKVVGHFGYLMDMVVLGMQVRQSFIGGSTAVGIPGKLVAALSYLRLWRLYRLAASIISQERDDHAMTRKELDACATQLGKFKMELATKEEDCDKEKEARDLVELMLQDYKERVDELNEALIIASKEILEVGARDDVNFDSDEDDDDVADYESMLDEYSKSSKSGHSHNHDGASVNSGRPNIYELAAQAQNEAKPKPTTIVVGQDGTFTKL